MNSPNYKPKKHARIKVKLGKVYLFENYLVIEFNEGVHIKFDDFSEITELVKIHYKNEPFGFISNRINSYSIDLNDADLYNKAFPNLKAYAVVVYKPLTEAVFEIEDHFFKFNRRVFKNLLDAIEWLEKVLSDEI